MIRPNDLGGSEFVSEEVAERCRRMLLMLENSTLPARAIENRQESRNAIVKPKKAEREQVTELWIVSEGRNGESSATEDAQVTSDGVVRAHAGAPRISIRTQPATVGHIGDGGQSGAMVRMWAMREKFCAGQRVVVYP